MIWRKTPVHLIPYSNVCLRRLLLFFSRLKICCVFSSTKKKTMMSFSFLVRSVKLMLMFYDRLMERVICNVSNQRRFVLKRHGNMLWLPAIMTGRLYIYTRLLKGITLVVFIGHACNHELFAWIFRKRQITGVDMVFELFNCNYVTVSIFSAFPLLHIQYQEFVLAKTRIWFRFSHSSCPL